MKFRNGMYLFATAIVAGTMGLASCSNEEDVVAGGEAQGATSKVTLGVHVNGGVNKKASQDDVNLGGNIANISNVVVVPMANGVYQMPIGFGNLTQTTQSKVMEASLLTTVNEFMVYGNIPTAVAGTGQFAPFEYTVASTQADPNLEANGFTAPQCGPMALIYGANATAFATATDATAENFWLTTGGATWVADQTAITTATKGIKIDGVKYQVGVLASKVFENTKCDVDAPEFNTPDGKDALTAGNWETEICANMKLTGVFVEGQATTINDKLAWTGNAWLTDVAPSSATVTHATFADGAWADVTGKIAAVEDGETQKVDGADFYTVVAPDADDNITVSFQFQNNTGRTLTLNSGAQVADGAYAYYSVKLNKKESKDVFAAFTTTILNARITDWGNGTPTPPLTTDVVIGVEFDVNWAAGLSYEFDI